MQSNAFDMSWGNAESKKESKYTAWTVVPKHFFSIDELHLRLSSFSVTSLADDWRQVDGMVAALTQLPSWVCIHVDRCVMHSSNCIVTKCSVKQP